ncbi:MAG: GNAT family N-acetyltransferase [Clostridia bacterium]|nr:GNAT family N-acetyltransferase [Clostridia bacterium]
MEIRKAKITDDFSQITTLIYNTDKYIYPYMFFNTKNWKEILIDMIKTKGTLFYYDNILLAVENEKIAGIVIFFNQNTYFSKDYSKWQNIDKNIDFTIKNYILPTISHKLYNSIYISNVCVNSEFRGQGISKKLLNHLFETYKDTNFELDVLSDNSIAINLYKSFNFTITGEIKGFNARYKRKPKVFNMKRNFLQKLNKNT